MSDALPLACSLGASDLQRRLDEIAAVGAEGLTSRQADGDRHVLRFRASAEIRERLGAIVAAEQDCCSFLDLALTEQADELVLTIGAPVDAQPIADELARAFAAAGV